MTLHNSALISMDEDPTGGFRKLNFLLQNPPAPPETFGNLLLLYCKPQHAFYDLAADVMAERTSTWWPGASRGTSTTFWTPQSQSRRAQTRPLPSLMPSPTGESSYGNLGFKRIPKCLMLGVGLCTP